MTTNNNELLELEEMRQQLNVLKAKVDAQQVINEKMLRMAMRDKYSWIDRQQRVWTVVCLLMIPYSVFVFRTLLVTSWAFVAATLIYFLVCFAAIIKGNSILNKQTFVTENMREVSEKILAKKRFDRHWKMTGWPMCVLWLAFFFYEVGYKGGTFSFDSGLIGGVVGLVIGLIAAFFYMHKYNKTLNEMEEETRRFVEENE